MPRRLTLAAVVPAGVLALTVSDCRPRPAARSAAPPDLPHWIVDPRLPGPSLPPVGRSLFDHLVAVAGGGRLEVPFPFTALTAALEAQLEPSSGGTALKRVLIPRGRSLQRDAATPEFFRYPRAVVAVDGDPAFRAGRAAMLLKDRLFLGYHEKATVLEVISYNEAAGRFEFQVVKDYRPGGRARVFYANRNLCMACHQNGGPIFARQLWDETNANPGIAARLLQEQRVFYGIPVEQGVDEPYELDNATDRANRFSAYQLLWREGCGPRSDPSSIACRADLFTLALQYRLSGGLTLDRRSTRYLRVLREHLPRRWRSQWPHGLLLPNPDIPNRIPLRPQVFEAMTPARVPAAGTAAAQARLAELVRQTDVPSAFEPLNPREPLEVWDIRQAEGGVLERLAAGLGEFLAEADIRRLDERLAAQTTPRPSRLTSLCTMDFSPRTDATTRISFTCSSPAVHARDTGRGSAGFAMTGRVYVQGAHLLRGSIDFVAVEGVEEVPGLAVQGGAVAIDGTNRRATLEVRQRSSGRLARRANGHRIESLALVWPGGRAGGRSAASVSGRAELATSDDFSAVEKAVDDMAAATKSGELDVFDDRPFRRASLLAALEARLGTRSLVWCCLDDRGLPPAALDEHTSGGEGDAPADERLRSLQRYCGRCHETGDRFPPNFLHGSTAEVEANVAHCAERIFFRLGMWGLAADTQPKTPMPPVSALTALDISREEWPAHPDLKRLQEYVAEILRTQQGRPPAIRELSARGYGNLQSCLAGAEMERRRR